MNHGNTPEIIAKGQEGVSVRRAIEHADKDTTSKAAHLLKKVILWLSATLAISYSVMVFWLVLWHFDAEGPYFNFQQGLLRNANSTVGLPAAALCAFFLVWAFPFMANDKITEFKAIGIEFKGVASQVILWILVYLSIVASIVCVAGK